MELPQRACARGGRGGRGEGGVAPSRRALIGWKTTRCRLGTVGHPPSQSALETCAPGEQQRAGGEGAWRPRGGVR